MFIKGFVYEVRYVYKGFVYEVRYVYKGFVYEVRYVYKGFVYEVRYVYKGIVYEVNYLDNSLKRSRPVVVVLIDHEILSVWFPVFINMLRITPFDLGSIVTGLYTGWGEIC